MQKPNNNDMKSRFLKDNNNAKMAIFLGMQAIIPSGKWLPEKLRIQ
jgi:hypothetical protein